LSVIVASASLKVANLTGERNMAALNRIVGIAAIVALGTIGLGFDNAAEAQATNANPPLLPAPTAGTTAATPWAKVVALQAGWTIDQMLVFTDQPAPITNPGGCNVTTNGYVTNPADSGHNLFHTILLSALLNAREVQFVIFDCWSDRPRIISVGIR
jgi:hypothetical protein